MNNRENQSGNNPTIKDFVLQQAHQRSFEIGVLGLKEYERERARIITERRQGQQAQFEKKHKEAQANVRIHKSALINGSRMKKMKARHEDLLKIVSESEIQLKEKVVNNRTEYTNLLRKLILEGLIRMLEPIVYVRQPENLQRCLIRDRDIVRSVLEGAKNDFRNLIIKQGIDESVANVNLILDEKFSLEEHDIGHGHTEKISKGEENTKCFGGVLLTSEDGLIVCKNTLDSRIDLAYQNMLPTIRQTLFPL